MKGGRRWPVVAFLVFVVLLSIDTAHDARGRRAAAESRQAEGARQSGELLRGVADEAIRRDRDRVERQGDE